MADDHDNNHDSDLEDRTPHKNADTTPKDTLQLNNEKDSPNAGAMEELQDPPARTKIHSPKRSGKLNFPKDFKAPDMTPYGGIISGHHLSNFRRKMHLMEASDAIRYSPSRRTKPNTH
ncbi:hypothetical protein AHAS_Ahas02G0117900 [Arachis hypogaea]